MGGRAGRAPEEEPRLRGRLPVLWRSATEVQLGTDPRWSVALTDLTPGAARALGGLPASAERRTLVAAMRRAGCAEAEVRSVLAHLAAAHLLVPPMHPDASGDEGAWALVERRGDGGSTSARRAGSSVAVHGLGRTGTAVAAMLAAAGVGTVVLVDDGTVTRHDLGVGGLRLEDVGLARTAAVGRLLLGVAPGVRTRPTGTVDLTVLVEHHAADPVRYSALHDAGRAHLSVVVREASVLVGPLVRPGATACLRCVDLARSRRDDRWPAVAAQLARVPPGPEETTLAATAGALAAAQALAHLDGRPVTVEGAALVVALPDAVPRTVTWEEHPECGCVGPSVQPSEPAAERGRT